MTEIFVALVVLLILVIITFLFFKRIVNKVNEQAKLYFTLKLQEYDELVKEKEEKLRKIKEDTDNKEKSTEIKEDISKTSVVVLEDNKRKYQVDDLLKTVKKVEDRFKIDNEKILKQFLNNKPTKEELVRFNHLEKMKNEIIKMGVYNIVTSTDENLLNELFDKLRMVDVDIVDAFALNTNNPTVEDFLNYLENELNKCDPHIYVEVGDKNVNFDYLSDRIVTEYNEKIYKGIMVIYRNKMYDYSL